LEPRFLPLFPLFSFFFFFFTLREEYQVKQLVTYVSLFPLLFSFPSFSGPVVKCWAKKDGSFSRPVPSSLFNVHFFPPIFGKDSIGLNCFHSLPFLPLLFFSLDFPLYFSPHLPSSSRAASTTAVGIPLYRSPDWEKFAPFSLPLSPFPPSSPCFLCLGHW